MVRVPVVIFGSLAQLWLFGLSLNVYSMICLVLVIGLVSENSIRLVDLFFFFKQKTAYEV